MNFELDEQVQIKTKDVETVGVVTEAASSSRQGSKIHWIKIRIHEKLSKDAPLTASLREVIKDQKK